MKYKQLVGFNIDEDARKNCLTLHEAIL